MKRPNIIECAGSNGCGKTATARWLKEVIEKQGGHATICKLNGSRPGDTPGDPASSLRQLINKELKDPVSPNYELNRQKAGIQLLTEFGMIYNNYLNSDIVNPTIITERGYISQLVTMINYRKCKGNLNDLLSQIIEENSLVTGIKEHIIPDIILALNCPDEVIRSRINKDKRDEISDAFRKRTVAHERRTYLEIFRNLPDILKNRTFFIDTNRKKKETRKDIMKTLKEHLPGCLE